MINRILIRIKVAQILYSYLLTRSEFKIQSAPETTSRDRKYAYSLYLDMILFMLELSGYPVKNGERNVPLSIDKKLASCKMAKALAADDDIKRVILKGNSNIRMLDGIAQEIHDKIEASAAFKDYKKLRSPQLKDDVKMWTAVLNTIILNDNGLIEALRANPEFTNVGMAKAIEMVTDTLNSYNDSRATLNSARESLERSLDKAYELYASMFQLIIELTDLQEERLENAKTKYLATPEDLNPNTKFIENGLVERLRSDEKLAEYIKENKITWTDDPVLMRSLLDDILASDVYHGYMANPKQDYQLDCDFWRELLKCVIFPSDTLAEALEAKSIFWNDDLPILGSFVVKTLKQMSLDYDQTQGITLLSQYKDEEDANFGADLFMLAVNNYDLYRSYIDRFINNEQWDSERLAFMDIVVMVTAIAELINYPAIPIAVTMNEYIEIANSYSTPRSGQFVNGLLYSVSTYLQQEGIINKA